MEKLSVIVPVYNANQYLRECLDSIINQTYKDLDIILINDASPCEEDDNICKEYAAKDERIKYIKHIENQGPSVAKKTGIQHAAGKYITFVDSDDYLLDLNCYNELIQTFDRDKSVNLIVFDAIVEYKRYHKKVGYISINSNDYISLKHIPIASFSMCNKIYKTKDVKKIDYMCSKQKFYEDNLFWIEYISKNNVKFIYVRKNYYYYRTVKTSLTRKKQDKKLGLWLEEIYNCCIKYNKNKVETKIFVTNYFNEVLNSLEEKDLTDNTIEEFNNVISNNAGLQDFIHKNIDSLMLYGLYINDSKIRNKFINEISVYKKCKYKHIKPVIELILIKFSREIKRVINQIKNLFKK